jgi:hypothetical protein
MSSRARSAPASLSRVSLLADQFSIVRNVGHGLVPPLLRDINLDMPWQSTLVECEQARAKRSATTMSRPKHLLAHQAVPRAGGPDQVTRPGNMSTW